MQKPDEATRLRLKNLAYVGNAVFKNASDVTGQNEFFLAMQALLDFEKGINDLELEPDIAEGMQNLIKYLKIKIERRMKERI